MEPATDCDVEMPVTSKFSNTQATNLWELLNGDDQFLVPQFQRNYAWTEEMAGNLWDDLTDSFQSVKKRNETQSAQYLLGPMVLVPDKENRYLVIDGQQRLSTITMLFCVARDIMLENITTQPGFKPEGYSRIMDMLENVGINGKHVSWKMVLNDTDKELFQQIQEYEDMPTPQVERIKKFKPKAKSQKLLASNYIYLYYRMMEVICPGFKSDSNASSRPTKNNVQQNLGLLNQFLNHVMRNNFIVKIVVDDDDTAYQIFETLNYRGETLSKSNLIKNYVLNKVKNANEQRDMSNAWNNIFDDIISQGEADDVFILESFRSRYYGEDKRASRKKLYDTVRKKIKTEREAKAYIKSLKDDAEFLTTLYNPISYQDRKTKDYAYAIKLLNAKSIRVPILTAYRKWYDERRRDYEQLVQFLVKFFFNRRIVIGTHAGKLEQIMSEIVKMIEEDKSAQSIISYLQKDYDHDDFKHNFNKFMSAPTLNPAKYALQQITISLGTKDSDVKPIDSLTLEHILPKNSDKWDKNEFFIDYKKSSLKMDEFVGHLGNLTLLKDVVNKKLQNETFLRKKGDCRGKKTGYCASNLEINRQTVCNHDKWTAKIIEDRSNLLAEYAYKIWDLANQ